MTQATQTNLVVVSKMPVVKILVDTKRDDLFKLKSISVTEADKKQADVMQAIATFTTTYKQVKASNLTEAENMYKQFLKDTFSTSKTRRVGKTKASGDKKEADKKEDKPKAEKTKAEPKVKYIASFKHFCETSSVNCLPLSPDNEKLVKTSLEQFTRYNKTLTSTLSADEEKLLTRKDNIQAISSLINRNTIRLLITETNSKNKLVAQYLLKPVYFSPYSFLCVAEAHNRDTKESSMYEYLINSIESTLTCYDSFQFNPLLETLTTSEVEKSKNKVTYQFVNIV